MGYIEAKKKYAQLGVDTDAAIARLKTVPVALHCWQGDDVRGFDTDPTKPLTGGIQTTGNYPGRARTPEELMADFESVLKLTKMGRINLCGLIGETHSPVEAGEVYKRLCEEKTFPLVQFDWR